jgi:membrane protein implicated in regulation of membrane protease activity
MSDEAKDRGRVRIWDKDWNCLVDEREQDGDTVSDVINRALDAAGEQPAGEAR